jgi:hypothetical protein
MNDQELRMAVECQLLNAGNREGLFADALKKFADLIRADEREANAKVCEKVDEYDLYFGSQYAEIIRARENT